MKRPGVLVSLVWVMALLFGCEKAPKKLPVNTAVPAQVLGVVSVASLNGALGDIAAFANEIQPGVGGMVSSPLLAAGLGKAMGATSLMGLNWDGAVHVAVVHRADAEPAFVLVAQVADAKALREGLGTEVIAVVRGSTAVIGAKASADLVAPWAFGGLTAAPAPANIKATAYPAHLQAIYGEQIAAGLAQMEAAFPPEQKQLAGYYKSMWETLATEADAFTFEAAANPAKVDFWMGVRGKPGTKLAAMIAAQRPDDYALLRKLPGRNVGSFMVGSFALGPYADAFKQFLSSSSPAMAGWQPMFDQMIKAEPVQMAGLFVDLADMKTVMQIGDAAMASGVAAAMADAMAKTSTYTYSGITVTMANVQRHAMGAHDVLTYEQTTSLDEASPQAAIQRANPALALGQTLRGSAAAVGPLFVFGVEPKAKASTFAASLAAASSATADAEPFPQVIEDMLAASRAAGESFVMAYDIQALVPMMLAASGRSADGLPALGFTPIEFGVGTANGELRYRSSATTAVIKAGAAVFRAMAEPAPAAATGE